MSDEQALDKRQQRQTFTLTRDGKPYTITTDGHGNVVEDDREKFERQMKVARELMEKRKDVLAA